MDDLLEQPGNVLVKPIADEHNEEIDQPSDEEDGGPDWTKLPSGLSISRPVIPKRGDKDFEPSRQGGSALQQHMLDRMRSAMFNALNVSRVASSKNISYGIWIPTLARAHVTVSRGTLFTSMGHSAQRPLPTANEDVPLKVYKRQELLPEEALYLVERGSMLCYKQDERREYPSSLDGEEIEGVPMTVQQAYAEMIGMEDMTLEKYQVFAYLKRLGYVVTRAHPPNSFYPVPPPSIRPSPPHSSWHIRLGSYIMNRFRTLFSRRRDWWKPLYSGRWFHREFSYPTIFASLRFIPTGHGVRLHSRRNICQPEDSKATSPSPYNIFFNLYKPSTPYRKTAPPPPDFQIVVINARTTPVPSLHELTDLFDILPEMPLPPPRKRQVSSRPSVTPKESSVIERTLPSGAASLNSLPFWTRVLAWFFPSCYKGKVLNETPEKPLRRPNPFQALKAGKKAIIIAVVDAGTVSFFRFGQGAFHEWPMV